MTFGLIKFSDEDEELVILEDEDTQGAIDQ
jgi:hypothetical protein